MNLKVKSLLSLSSILFLAACPSPPSVRTPSLPHHDVKTEEATLNASGINTAVYRLKNDLSFADAEVVKGTQFKGTSLQYESTRYSLTYVNQRKVSANEASTFDSYCQFSVETSQDVSAGDVRFSASDKLLTGTWSYFSDDLIGTIFVVPLQGQIFQTLLLSCSNVLDLEHLRSHVGNILEITPASPAK